ncbi:MAG: gliding motility protein GldL [Prevotella sp.]|nr:gliding motility protein GldL [Prevotella sp.]
MTQYSKLNIIYRLQKWMDSVPGQTFLNYAYSWGAAIVILGTLFKLTHIPGANFWLFLGMGTEVFVFFLSAFDRPFDKTADGMDLPTHLRLDEDEESEDEEPETDEGVEPVVRGGVAGGGTIIIGGGVAAAASPGVASAGAGDGSVAVAAMPGAAEGSVQPPVIPPLTPDMTEATNAYVDELKKLTEVLERVSEQSRRLTTDSEEMENLNRTLTGICKVYEMQLRSASSQIGTIDEINEQTKKMAQQIEQLNNIYARMIEAMTMKMKVE